MLEPNFEKADGLGISYYTKRKNAKTKMFDFVQYHKKAKMKIFMFCVITFEPIII
jgi:hypothetical protein